MPLPSALEARVAELERERKHLLAIIEILKEVSTSLHFIDILQGIARKLGEAVFRPDAATDPSLKDVKGELISRRVKSITVVQITWRGGAIGAILLRTFRDGPTF